MSNNNIKFFDAFVSKAKIYLVIIAILLILICIFKPVCIIPSIIIYIAVVAYSVWTDNKRKAELSEHFRELNFNVDSVSKKSLINSPFPLLMAETNGNIIWKNAKFVQEFNNVKDITDYINQILKDIKLEIINNEKRKNNKIKTKVVIGKKKYKIVGEYIKVKSTDKKSEKEYMATLYFVDETEKEKLAQDIKDTNVCVGVIKIDNYEDTMQKIDSEDQSQIKAKIEKNIYEWANKFEGMIIKSERDTFILVCEQKDLIKLEEEKFSILNDIKGINIPEKVQPTLSISISNEGNNYTEKYKNAKDGIDIALGRGGDQAVVKENGKYIFFGGKSEEQEKITKVRARTVAQALEEIMNDSDNVIVMGHDNADIDCIGAALGIARIAKTIGKEVKIANETTGTNLSKFIEAVKENQDFSEVFIDGDKAMELTKQNTLLVIVDTNSKSYVEFPELLEKTSKIAVIDHHRMSTSYIDNSILSFQEVYASSASELVTELIVYSKNDIKLTDVEAAALYAGIMMDTKNFTFKTGVRTFEAAAYLRRCGVDIIKVKKWFQNDLKTYSKISQIVGNSEIVFNSIAVATYDEKDNEANIICAKAADALLTISDVNAAFVIGKMAGKIFISGRSVGDINVQVILEKLGGGGHMTLAGAQLEGTTIEDAKAKLIDKINEYFIDNI